MFYRTIFVCLVGFDLVKLVKMDPSVITFNIQSEQSNGSSNLTCDHSLQKSQQNLYTVYENSSFTIVTTYNNVINDIICHALTDERKTFVYKSETLGKTNITFKGEKTMGTVWKCTILAHRDSAVIQPVVQYKEQVYSAAYCYMKIHVRQKVAPQTILVNNMEMQAVRTNLSREDVDFIAEYQYEDGDEVEVVCINQRSDKMLTMEYEMAGTMSDKSTMEDLKSSKQIGFSTRLHSGHHNSYMICTHTEDDDYTKVMVRFTKRTNNISYIDIKINGMVLQPLLTHPPNNHYEIEYKYVINQMITVTCKVKNEEEEDVKLLVLDDDFAKLSGYSRNYVSTRKAVIKFYLGSTDDKKLTCACDYTSGESAETLQIHFTAVKFPVDQYKLQMNLSTNNSVMSNDRVMELYNDYKLNVIFYEFKDGETLQLTCGQLQVPPPPGPVLYLEFDSVKCETNDCSVYKTMQVTDMRERKNTPISCYIKENHNPSEPGTKDIVHREIRVILRERVLTTTTTSTTTTTTTSTTRAAAGSPARAISSSETEKNPKSHGTAEQDTWLHQNMTKLAIIACCAVCIIITCASIVIVKLRKRNHSQGGPHNRNYENLQEPSEASIPAYPPQWENNYAVPVDRRTEDTTYSVPCPPADLYATPTPKTLRNKKQKPLDPTYAVLDDNRNKKNMFQETEDPNYSEVYANRPEACYAKVLPKSHRNKMEQDNPYSYVTNDRPCAFTADPEPMYCEPGSQEARGADYANLNNSHYVNSNASEYVEPTYCEPPKRM